MNNVIAAVALIMLAGLSNGLFALPMRYNRTWKYENTWLVFTIFCLTLFPWLLTLLFVHRLPELLASLTPKDVAPALIFGFLWGIAMATFGIALALLGISIVLPIVSGLTLIVGTFTPVLARHPEILRQRVGFIMELSAILLIGSLLLYGKAARMREGASGSKRSLTGLMLAVFTGLFGGMINIGFALSDRIVQQSRLLGNNAVFSTYPVWAFVLTAGLIPNVIYCVYLLITQRTAKLFISSGGGVDFMRSLLMAVLWITATASYGMSTAFLGKLGTSLGFLLYGAFSIVFSNVIGWKAGEWTNASSPAMKLFWSAMGLALASIGLLGVAG